MLETVKNFIYFCFSGISEITPFLWNYSKELEIMKELEVFCM